MGGYHESLFRSYHILAKTKDLLKRNVDPELILELISVMEDRENIVNQAEIVEIKP